MICNKTADMLPDLSEIVTKDEAVCPVDWALHTIDQARREVCGREVLCRDGLNQLWHILTDDVSGRGDGEDLELLQDLLKVIGLEAGCKLAQTAAENVLKSMQLYPDEWELHIKRKRCTALRCKAYYTIHIATDRCNACGNCLGICPEGAIAGGDGLIHVINNDKCSRCGQCLGVCPEDAIAKAGGVKPKTPESPVPLGSFEAGGGLRRRRRGT